MAPPDSPTRQRHSTYRTSPPAAGEILDFADRKAAFQSRSLVELLRSWLVLEVFSVKTFVVNSGKILSFFRKIFGDRVAFFLVKATFFKQFCAGETQDDIQPTVRRLKSLGIGSILDYAAEHDIYMEAQQEVLDQAQGNDKNMKSSLKRQTEEWEKNKRICMQCIAASADSPGGFAAIKLSALGRPQLLERMSRILTDIRTLFFQFRDGKQQGLRLQPPKPHTHAHSAGSASVSVHSSASGAQLGPYGSTYNQDGLDFQELSRDTRQQAEISIREFRRGLEELEIELDEQQLINLFNQFDATQNGHIDYLEWTDYLNIQDLRTRPFFVEQGRKKKSAGRKLVSLNKKEEAELDQMLERLDNLARYAADKKVRLMIDAEQTYFQPAIDNFTRNLQRKYNRQFPVIFNTFQCYLKDSKDRVIDDLERSRRECWIFACKLVRGAYMSSERKLAIKLGYNDPVWENIDATHRNYHDTLDLILREIVATGRPNVMVASHNVDTVNFTVKKMRDYNIPADAKRVFFGQLLGMADHLTMILGQNWYSVYKYVPYGPVHETIPYLIRRAEENSDVLSGLLEEKKLIRKEIARRVFKSA